MYLFQTNIPVCFSLLQEQFEFALAAVAEEVHAILKALPQWWRHTHDDIPGTNQKHPHKFTRLVNYNIAKVYKHSEPNQ